MNYIHNSSALIVKFFINDEWSLTMIIKADKIKFKKVDISKKTTTLFMRNM